MCGSKHSIPAPPTNAKYCSDQDNTMLEDESGRLRLVGERLKSARLVTGVIIGALGIETSSGDFEVVDICFAEMAPQPGSAKESPDEGAVMDVDGKALLSSFEMILNDSQDHLLTKMIGSLSFLASRLERRRLRTAKYRYWQNICQERQVDCGNSMVYLEYHA